MRARQATVHATRGGTALVTLERGEYATTVRVDDAQVMFKIRGKPWTVSHDCDDLALVLDACRGALEITEGLE